MKKTIDELLSTTKLPYAPHDRHPNIMVQIASKAKVMFCNDCRCIHPPGYMVHDYLWNSVVPMRQRMFLCFECLEARISRKLTIDDFTDCLLNEPIRFAHSMATRQEPTKVKLPFDIDNAIVRLQRAAQDEGEAYQNTDKLRNLQQETNKRRAELEAAILKHLTGK